MHLDSYIESDIEPGGFICENLHLSFPTQVAGASLENINEIRQYLEKKNIKLGQAKTSTYYVNLKMNIQKNELDGLIQRMHTLLEQRKKPIINYKLTLLVKDESCRHFSIVGNRINALKNKMAQLSIHVIQFDTVNFATLELPLQNIANLHELIFYKCNFAVSTINVMPDEIPKKLKFHFCKFERVNLLGEGTFAMHQSQIEYLDSKCSEIMLCNIEEIGLFTQRNLEGTK